VLGPEGHGKFVVGKTVRDVIKTLGESPRLLGVSDMITALNTMKVINMKNLVLMMMMFNSYARTFTSFNI
jgi:hypothetical protein